MGEIKQVPLMPMREEVFFPGMVAPFFIGRKASLEAVDYCLRHGENIFVVTQRNTSYENPGLSDLYTMGTVGTISKVIRLPNGTIKALYDAVQRARLLEIEKTDGYVVGKIELVDEESVDEDELDKKAAQLREILIDYTKNIEDSDDTPAFKNIEEIGNAELADFLCSKLPVEPPKKQLLLEEVNPIKRLERVSEIISSEVDLKKMAKDFKEKVRKTVDSTHIDDYLNDQIRAIQKELGQSGEGHDDFSKYEEQISGGNLPVNIEEIARKELKKLRMMNPVSAEVNISRNYLDWILALPWSNRTSDNYDLDKVKKILDGDHYGLQDIKERILEYIAVSKLRGKLKGPILCFVGPPGVGKTSLVQSIAKALGRNFARLSLGGIRDEAEIRGHRRTYIGAMPGKIIQAIRKSKSTNPVILMDEIDKLYASIMGDPSAALLEVLDPEQNRTFVDHYLEIEYDLSDAMFVCTANSLARVPHPLIDRMEIMNIAGYTATEKLHICNNYLLPKQKKEHGLDKDKVTFYKTGLEKIIREYTREAGVRNLERELKRIMRKLVTQQAKGEKGATAPITTKRLQKLLGPPIYTKMRLVEEDKVGICIGLGVSGFGGEILLMEVRTMPGSGKRYVTGKLGDVMKESVQIAISCVRSRADNLGIFTSNLKRLDLHIHLPEGSIPKDGPSAGMALVAALVSSLTGIPIRHDVAVTGEVSLRGTVFPVGGIKEKLFAAKQNYISEVIIPIGNEKNLADVPDEITNSMKIHLVKNIDEAIKLILTQKPVPLNKTQLAKEHLRINELYKQHSAIMGGMSEEMIVQ